MRNRNSIARTKAIHAARAVTLGGVLLAAGCGGNQTPDDTSDQEQPTGEGSGQPTSLPGVTVTEPTGSLPTLPPGTEVEVQTNGECKHEPDGVCPPNCTMDNDYDCCETQQSYGWCSYDPSYGCGCAVEGPFAPPSMIL